MGPCWTLKSTKVQNHWDCRFRTSGLGLGTLVIKHVSENLTASAQMFCDCFFTTIPAVDHMLKNEIYLTGTVMKNRISQAMKKIPDDKTLKQ